MSSPEDDLRRWHQTLAEISGEISIALTLRSVKASHLERWDRRLTAAREEIRKAAKNMRGVNEPTDSAAARPQRRRR